MADEEALAIVIRVDEPAARVLRAAKRNGPVSGITPLPARCSPAKRRLCMIVHTVQHMRVRFALAQLEYAMCRSRHLTEFTTCHARQVRRRR